MDKVTVVVAGEGYLVDLGTAHLVETLCVENEQFQEVVDEDDPD